MRTFQTIALILSLASLFAGCTSTPMAAPSAVPASLQAPEGSKAYLEALASGVQIYECARKPDATYAWAFKSPEAALTDRSGRPLGKHYAGPTWEANDASLVVGEVKARDAGPSPSAVPWLLLAAKSNRGAGTFADAKFVQRLATVGGVAPADACTEATLNNQARIPYSATYIFYR